MLTLVIGNKNYSSWSLRAWLLLTANGIAFREVRIPLDTPSTRSELARYSDACKVPVLLDDNLTVWDSLAISEFVSEKYLAGGGWPDAEADRARARAATAEMHSSFSSLRSTMPMNCRARGRRVEFTDALRQDVQRITAIWNSLLSDPAREGPWLCGKFGIVDCAYAPVASRFLTYGVKPDGDAADYMERLLDHPAMQQWYADAKLEPETLEREEAGR